MKAGAYQYVTKPVDIDNLSLVVERALEARSLRLENRRLTVERLSGPVDRRFFTADAAAAPAGRADRTQGHHRSGAW